MAISNQHRFAISALSKTEKDSAYLEEFLADKDTGEVLFKTPDGDIVSFVYMNRLKTSLDQCKQIADNKGIFGNIYNIEFDDLMLPVNINSLDVTNYLSTPCTLGLTGNKTKFKRLFFYCDIASFSTISNTLTKDEYYPYCKIGLTLTFNDNTTKAITLNNNTIMPITTLNNTIIDLSDYLTENELAKDIKNISFTNFEIDDSSVTDINGNVSNTSITRTILYSLFVLLENH